MPRRQPLPLHGLGVLHCREGLHRGCGPTLRLGPTAGAWKPFAEESGLQRGWGHFLGRSGGALQRGDATVGLIKTASTQLNAHPGPDLIEVRARAKHFELVV